jgi:SHS2 domain-containing protein
MIAPFDYLEHTADACLRGIGTTREEAFCEAARAMFHLMVDVDQVRPQKRVQVSVTAEKIDLLLVEWLAELLVRKDLEDAVFSRFRVAISGNGAGFDLKGEGWGERLDPARHHVKSDVKGVTYAGLRVYREEDRWIAQCVVDI